MNLPLPGVAAGMLAAVLLTAPGARAAPPAEAGAPCAKGRTVKVKPKEHKKKVRKAASLAELKALLASSGLDTRWSEGRSCQAQASPDVTLDVFRARILSAEKEDFVLQARGTVCELRILVGAVLHPMEEADTFCAIPIPFLPGVVEGYEETLTFGFENLTDPVRQVFKVESTWHDSRNSGQDLAYWEAQEGELRSIFTLSSGESIGWIHGSASAKATVLSGAYPRAIDIEESTETCGEFVDMPSGERVYSSDCTRAENNVRMCYQKVAEFSATATAPKGSFAYRPCTGAQ